METCVSVVWCSGVEIIVRKQPEGGDLESRRNCKRDVVTSIRSCETLPLIMLLPS
jgi:hypothetical protein